MVFAHTKQQDNYYKTMIKLRCSNPKCQYKYKITPDELKDNGELHTHCLFCGFKIEVTNLSEVIDRDLNIQIKQYIDKWIKSEGIEGCIELVERNKNQACYRLYKEELEKRGFKVK